MLKRNSTYACRHPHTLQKQFYRSKLLPSLRSFCCTRPALLSSPCRNVRTYTVCVLQRGRAFMHAQRTSSASGSVIIRPHTRIIRTRIICKHDQHTPPHVSDKFTRMRILLHIYIPYRRMRIKNSKLIVYTHRNLKKTAACQLCSERV